MRPNELAKSSMVHLSYQVLGGALQYIYIYIYMYYKYDSYKVIMRVTFPTNWAVRPDPRSNWAVRPEPRRPPREHWNRWRLLSENGGESSRPMASCLRILFKVQEMRHVEPLVEI